MEGRFCLISMTFRGALQFGLLTCLFGIYFVLVVFITEKYKLKEYSNPFKAKAQQPVTRSLFSGPASNTTLTLYTPKKINSHFPTMNKSKTMLVQDFNAAPHTEHQLSFKGCSYPCALTNDSSTADLLYLNAGQMSPRTALPSHRKKNQVWLLSSREPPTFHRFVYLNRTDLKGQINWTRAIFSDATFPLKYGTLHLAEQVVERDFDSIYESKRRAVAWFVGHCDTQSRREEYVKRMASRINIDIYGLCGNLTCGVRGYNMGGYKNKCLKMLSNKYKFYLAFENSFCENYVTEKFFNLFRDNHDTAVDVIPVVRGGADYKRLFDPAIFIDAADFSTPEDLADYLSQLANDKKRYVHMLRQKSKYTFGMTKEKFECALCRSLHLHDIPNQLYKDIYHFWKHPSRCYEPRDLG